MIQVLIPRQLRNGVEGLVLLSTTQKPWNSFSYLYLVAFSAFADTRLASSDLNWNFSFYFFVSPGDSGFFIPSFLSLSSLLLGASGLDLLAIPAEPPSPPMFFALLCVSWAVFSHDVSFLSVKWFFKTWGSPQVVKGVCLYQRMTPVPSTALAAGGKQMKRGWTTFFRS